ncbi:MAG: TetR/AcrR family transcriptional regulator [Acetivibrio sp.]
MNKTDISRKKILDVSISLLKKNKMGSLNMRSIAKECGVSVGSIYNYFPTKEELELAIVEAMWRDLFHSQQFEMTSDSGFIQTIANMYESILASQENYGDFFKSHGTIIEKNGRSHGKSAMEHYFKHQKDELLKKLNSDEKVKPNVWTTTFTQNNLIDFIISSMLTNQKKNYEMLLVILEKLLYENRE